MSSNARIFIAGVGTTVVILAVGFGSGLMMASSMCGTLPAEHLQLRQGLLQCE